MRFIVALLLLLLAIASFAWSFVGYTGPMAQWSDIQYILRDEKLNEATRAEIERVVLRSRRDWLVARWFSGGAAVLSFIVLVWPHRDKDVR